MAFVLDASVAACWAFEDEDHPTAAEALQRLHREEARVPGLWSFEILNLLVVNERRGRIVEADVQRFLRALSRLPIHPDSAPAPTEILRLARAHKLTAYDAAYVELAIRESAPLATLDQRLAAAAKAAGASLL